MKVSKEDRAKGMIDTPYTVKELRKLLVPGRWVLVQYHREVGYDVNDNKQAAIVVERPARDTNCVELIMVDTDRRPLRTTAENFDQILYVGEVEDFNDMKERLISDLSASLDPIALANGESVLLR